MKTRKLKVRRDGFVYCAKCETYLSPDNFYQTGKKQVNYASACKKCNKQYSLELRLKNIYGIDLSEYNRIFAIQNYACAICINKPKTRRLAVDHDHKTGQIRGLLCQRCNHGLLGSAHDSIPLLERAISYLEASPAQTGVPVLIHEDYRQKRKNNPTTPLDKYPHRHT